MNGRFFLRILFAIILIAALVGIGFSIYNTGVAQGMAASGKLPVLPNQGIAPYPYYAPFYPHFGWGFGFFPFGFIIPILFFFLFFALLRGLFFRGMMYRGWGRMGSGGPNGENWPKDVPPMVEEWHRKMHESSSESGGRKEEANP